MTSRRDSIFLLELRRQSFHLFCGVVAAFLVWKELFYLRGFTVLLVGGLALSLLCKRYTIPIISTCLDYFDRPNERKILPGQGSLYLVAGILLTVLLFPKGIAAASILILAIGDSLNHLIGRFFGKIKTPLNPSKNIEGSMVAAIVCTLALLPFIPWWKTLIASIIALTAELLEWEIIGWRINDNLVIPVVAGAVLRVVGAYV